MNPALWQWQIAYERLRVAQAERDAVTLQYERSCERLRAADVRVAEADLRAAADGERLAYHRDRELDAVGRQLVAQRAVDRLQRLQVVCAALLVDWLVYCGLVWCAG